MEYQALPKKDITRKRFRELPTEVRNELVKEQSTIAALFVKLAIHMKDQGFF